MYQDHLTGTSLTTDASGNKVDEMKYLPYGGTRSGDIASTERKFTGQRLDGTGLYYYGARYYDPQIGRFISADSIVQVDPRSSSAQPSLTVSFADAISSGRPFYGNGSASQTAVLDPQLLNRYSYSRNNPLGYVDDSGHWIWAAVGAVAGFSAYYFTHRDNFSWGQAAYWAAGGAIAGATLGIGAGLVAGSVRAGTAATAAGTAATRLLNATNWRQGEEMLSKVLGIAKNNTKFFVEGMTGNRVPDFVNRAEGYIADSKWVQKLSMTDQIRDLVRLAEELEVRLDIYVRQDTDVSQAVLDAVESTGGNIIRIFQ